MKNNMQEQFGIRIEEIEREIGRERERKRKGRKI